MAWTANLESVERLGSNVKIVIRYTSGTDSVGREYVLGASEDVKAFVNAKVIEELAQFEAADASVASVVLGPVSPKPIITPPPTQDEIDLATFLTARDTLNALNKQVAAGLLDPADKSISDAEVAFKTAFKPEYAKFL